MSHKEVVIFLEFVKSSIIVSLYSNLCISLVFLKAWCLRVYCSGVGSCEKHVATKSSTWSWKESPESKILSMNIRHTIPWSLDGGDDLGADVFITSSTRTLRFFDYRLIPERKSIVWRKLRRSYIFESSLCGLSTTGGAKVRDEHCFVFRAGKLGWSVRQFIIEMRIDSRAWSSVDCEIVAGNSRTGKVIVIVNNRRQCWLVINKCAWVFPSTDSLYEFIPMSIVSNNRWACF